MKKLMVGALFLMAGFSAWTMKRDPNKEEKLRTLEAFRTSEEKQEAEFNLHSRLLHERTMAERAAREKLGTKEEWMIREGFKRLSKTPVPNSFEGRRRMVDDADATVGALLAFFEMEEGQ